MCDEEASQAPTEAHFSLQASDAEPEPESKSGPEPGAVVTVTATSVDGKLTQVRGATRKRRRDGVIVPKSNRSYHHYKIAKRELRHQGLYRTGAGVEDRLEFSAARLLDWVLVRQYHCRMLAKLLLKAQIINQPMYDGMLYELDAVLGWISNHPVDAAKLELGTAALWVSMAAQQHRAMTMGGWHFKAQKEVDTWTLRSLWDVLEGTGVSMAKKEVRKQYLAIDTLGSIEQKAGTSLHFLLKEAKPDADQNPVRKLRQRTEPWLYPGIARLYDAELVDELGFDTAHSSSILTVDEAHNSDFDDS